MHELHYLQRSIFNSISPVKTGIDNTHILNSLVTAETIRNLEIYRYSSKMGLIKALAITYEVCAKLVGSEFFNSLAQRYVQRNIPLEPTLDGDYGIDFPDFIAQDPACTSLPYLCDIARLEWAWQICFNAEDRVNSFNKNAFAGLDSDILDNVFFTVPNEIKLISSNYPIDIIFMENKFKSEPDIINLDLNVPINILIWRVPGQVQISMQRLDNNTAMIFYLIASGAKLKQISDLLGDNQKLLTDALTRFISQGIIGLSCHNLPPNHSCGFGGEAHEVSRGG